MMGLVEGDGLDLLLEWMECCVRINPVDPCGIYGLQVNFHAREEYEFLANYNQLHSAFNTLGITRVSFFVFFSACFVMYFLVCVATQERLALCLFMNGRNLEENCFNCLQNLHNAIDPDSMST